MIHRDMVIADQRSSLQTLQVAGSGDRQICSTSLSITFAWLIRLCGNFGIPRQTTKALAASTVWTNNLLCVDVPVKSDHAVTREMNTLDLERFDLRAGLTRTMALFVLTLAGVPCAVAQTTPDPWRNSRNGAESTSPPDETLADYLIAREPTEVAAPPKTPLKASASRPWLDIRPRGIDAVETKVILAEDLPEDVSGLPALDDAFWAVQLHAANLTYADVAFASSHRYRPLYFEDRLLERYGSITGVLKYCPPLHATAQFAFSTATLPISGVKYPLYRAVGTGQPSRCEADVAVNHAAKRMLNKRR